VEGLLPSNENSIAINNNNNNNKYVTFMCKHRRNVCQSWELHINSTLKAIIHSRSIILLHSMGNLQMPGVRVVTHSKCYTVGTEFCSHMWTSLSTGSLAICKWSVVRMCNKIKKKNYVQNIRRCSTGFCSPCGKVLGICVRLKKTGILVVRN